MGIRQPKIIFAATMFFVLLEASAPVGQAADCGPKNLREKLRSVFVRRPSAVAPEKSSLEFRDLPDPSSYELPPAVKRLIRSSPIQKLRSQYGDGSDYAILLDHYVPGEKIEMGAFGEGIQAKFVAKVIREVFPNVELVAPENVDSLKGAKYTKDGKRVLWLGITDKAELQYPAPRSLNMPFIKAANPGIGAIDHNELRAPLGIPPESYVASIYVKGDSRLNLPSIFAELEKAGKPDLVFLSFGGTAQWEYFEPLARKAAGDYEIRFLSKFSASPREKGRKYLLLNDLPGKLPQIYNVSDVSIVRGPINLFESLTAGSPVVFFNNAEVLDNYKASAFSMMAQTALNTGGAVEIKENDQLSGAIRQARNLHPSPPYLVPVQAYGKAPTRPTPSALDVFLAHLQAKLRRALELSGAP